METTSVLSPFREVRHHLWASLKKRTNTTAIGRAWYRISIPVNNKVPGERLADPIRDSLRTKVNSLITNT